MLYLKGTLNFCLEMQWRIRQVGRQSLLQTLIRIDQEPGKAADHGQKRRKLSQLGTENPVQAAKSCHYAGNRPGMAEHAIPNQAATRRP